MSFVITRPDGSQTASGYRYAAPRVGTRTFESTRQQLPPRVDLRPFMTPVEDQGQTMSCAANAVAGAYEYLVKRHLAEDEAYDVSRMFIYYNGRAIDGYEGQDDGSVIGSLIESLKQQGACSEETWPFEPEQVNEEPSPEAYDEAAGFLVEDAALVGTSTDEWRKALADGYPIVFGISLYESFDKQRKPGVVPMPSPREASRESHGGHAMLAVGYSDADRVFIVRNSWGEGWGDRGYCYIPYDYLCNEKYNGGDSWIIRRVDEVPADEGWADDEESLLPELDSELANMSEEQFHALIDACGEVPFETRIAHLLLVIAGADGELGDTELESLAGHLATILEQAGSQYDPERVLRFALRHVDDEALLEETVQIFGEHFSAGLRATLVNIAEEIAASDELGDEEQDFIAQLVEAWQVER